MKAVRSISRHSSSSRSEDDFDQSDSKYKNLKNKTGSQKSTDSENTVGDYVNPVFRGTEEEKSITNNKSNETRESYDSLAFNDKTNRDNKPAQRPKVKPRTDITKPPEEIEMGVQNYGYNKEKPRPDSWDKSISFSPYAVDTVIGGPVDSRATSLSIPEKRLSDSSSKTSNYSFVSGDDENPYAAPSEKVSSYDTIPGQDYKKRPHQLPPPRQSTKKTNLAYESAVIKVEHSVKGKEPKEGYAEDEEQSHCCQMIFILLVGVVALIALIIVFLLMFGVISVKKCKECDIVEVPESSQQTGNQGGGSGGSQAILLEMQYLRNNLSALQATIANLQKPAENHTAQITLLENELTDQKLRVESLTDDLAKQMNVTRLLNETTKTLKKTLTQTKSQIMAMNTTQQIRHLVTSRSIQKVRSDVTENIMKLQHHVKEIKVNLTMDFQRTKVVLENDLKEKVSVGNFTKLINDSQYVVDQLYGMINTSNYKRNKLNETIHFVSQNLDTLFSSQIKELMNVSAMLEKNLTAYSQQIAKLHSNVSSSSLSNCTYDTKGKYLPINSSHLTATTSAKAIIPAGNKLISASCDVTANTVLLKEDGGNYKCQCTGVANTQKGIFCRIHYVYCPI